MNDTTQKTCNLNDIVRVTLTPKGKEHFNKFFKELFKVYGVAQGIELVRQQMGKIKEGDVLEVHLHEFIHIFGAGMIVGGPELITNNTVIFI
jgi:predicted SnoaL-like aldol condensation-catalyzing enzyme